MAIFQREPTNEGVECRWGRLKPRFPTSWLFCCTLVGLSHLETDQARSRAIHTHGSLWIVCITSRLNIMLKTTKQNQIACTGKFEAELTNNKKLCLTYCLLKLSIDRHETSCGLSEKAEPLV